jgi:hypothetical protein
MTVDEAIRALTLAREQLGGDAPLVMADGLGVRLVADTRQRCVYATDVAEDSQELEPAGLVRAG